MTSVDTIPVTVNQRKSPFNKSTKLVLLQSMKKHNAHRVGHGKKDKNFDLVINTFISNIYPTTWIFSHKHVVKTLRETFRMMMRVRKEDNARNMATSAIAEDVTVIDKLMDDLLLERN